MQNAVRSATDGRQKTDVEIPVEPARKGHTALSRAEANKLDDPHCSKSGEAPS